MNVLIIEDENPAAQRLERLLKSYDPSIMVLEKIPSVKKALEWFSANPSPELIFMDIQLSDGISFEIFEYCMIKCPVVFTTAYDEYALKAFKVNSIDYLLKPIDKEQLERAFSKLNGLVGNHNKEVLLEQVSRAMMLLQKQFKSRFLVKVGEHILTVPVNEILYFFSREKASFCHTIIGKNHLLDYSLDQLEAMVDPQQYFRVNRQYLISLPSIKNIISYSNSRLKLILQNDKSEDVIVSRERVMDFKSWLDR